jgi:hypothetical protein
MPGQGLTPMLSCSGGVQTNIADSLRPLNVLKIANNVNMIKRGVLTNRFAGWTKQRAGAFNSGAAFLDFGIFTSSTGAKTLCFQVGNRFYSYDGATETDMAGANLSTTNPPCIRMFAPYADGNPLMLYANGIDQPKKFSSTGAASMAALQLNGGNYPQALSGPLPTRTYSKPKFIEPFLDRVILAGFDASGSPTAFDILLTNAGTCETCTQTGAGIVATDGGLFTVSPDLGAVTSVKAFKLSNQNNEQIVLVGQDHGISFIKGNDALDFKMYTLTAEYGAPSNRCWVQMQNDLWFLSSDGMRRFSTLAQNANLLNAVMSLPVQDLLNRITLTSAKWAHLTHHKIYQELALWFPIDAGTTNANAIVINYNTGGVPEEINPMFLTKDGTSVACGVDFNNVMYGGGYDGLLQTHYSGNLYNTAPVQWQIMHAQIAPENKEEQIGIECILIETDGGSQKFLANTYWQERIGNSSRRTQADPADHEILGLAPGGTILDSWVLGSSALPEDGPKQHRYYPQGVGSKCEISYSGNMPDHFIDYVQSQVRIKTYGALA